MLKAVTAAEMRRIDETTIRERGVPGLELMERAGRAVAREAMERFEPQSVAILAGKGNNGGDGFIAARRLAAAGIEVRVFTIFDPPPPAGDARTALLSMPPEIPVEPLMDAGGLAERLRDYDLVIDALFGTGLRVPLEGLAAEVVEAVNAARVPVLSVDIPSGLLADGPDPMPGPCVRAAATLTIGLPKHSLILDPGRRAAGMVAVAPIDFPPDLLTSPDLPVNLMDMDAARAMLPPRPPGGHKGTFGRVLILAGSRGMTGAAVLAARAAVRSGAGLVFSAYPEPLSDIMESHLIEPVKRPLPGKASWFGEEHAAAALAEAEAADAVALGPGLGTRPETAAFVRAMVEGVRAPLVLDADGLNLLAEDPGMLERRPGPTIVTPHPGEAARLLRTTAAAVERDRLNAMADFAARTGAIAVLKGAQTIVTAPDGRRFVNPTGNSGLAKGGSGDVLTGLVAGLLAQGAAPLDAALLGVFLHGLTADLLAAKTSIRSMTPGELAEALGLGFLELERRPSIPLG